MLTITKLQFETITANARAIGKRAKEAGADAEKVAEITATATESGALMARRNTNPRRVYAVIYRGFYSHILHTEYDRVGWQWLSSWEILTDKGDAYEIGCNTYEGNYKPSKTINKSDILAWVR